NVTSQCDSLYNTLTWALPDSICADDLKGYRIYYKLTSEETTNLLIDIPDRSTFTYRHKPGDVIAGCYQISGYDANGNEGEKSVITCIDSCDFYEIPNVFTPNDDTFNDKLLAKTSGLVEKVDFKLFNRNGLLIFSTSDPRINWDGTYRGRIVSPGVYFYQCDVYENRISGLELFHLSGFVHVITEKGAKVSPEVTK
ncbi:MAG TPA: gliding motility-associated C-terminal domain-containing protein, partial [Bacteroidales bacterium]|nr:gliding motility-associated C-terminal domain-containing protein [Bacteroidales bacterium]